VNRVAAAISGWACLLLAVAAPALAGDFAPAVDNYVGGDVMDVAAGDLNGDGRPDLATAVELLPTAATLLNTGGAFGRPSQWTASGRPYSVTIADLDDDGDADLALTNLDDGVSVRLNRGDGSFGKSAPHPAGLAPTDVKAGDLNGDGRLDLAVVDNGSASVSVLLGRGDGRFEPPLTAPAGGDYPQQLALADFNRDGRLDVAVTVANADALVVLMGHGDGHLSAPTYYYPPEFRGWSPIGVAAGDFNGDRLADVAVSTADRVWVWRGRGDGTLGSPSGAFSDPSGDLSGARDVAAADFNGDGRLDLAVANGGTNHLLSNVTVLHGRGDGTLDPPIAYHVPPTTDSPATREAGAGANSLAVGDYNGDGRPDLAVGHSIHNSDPGGIAVLLNSGGWQPGALPPAPDPPSPGPAPSPAPGPKPQPQPAPHSPAAPVARRHHGPWMPKLHRGGKHVRLHRHRHSAQRLARLRFRLHRG